MILWYLYHRKNTTQGVVNVVSVSPFAKYTFHYMSYAEVILLKYLCMCRSVCY